MTKKHTLYLAYPQIHDLLPLPSEYWNYNRYAPPCLVFLDTYLLKRVENLGLPKNLDTVFIEAVYTHNCKNFEATKISLVGEGINFDT